MSTVKSYMYITCCKISFHWALELTEDSGAKISSGLQHQLASPTVNYVRDKVPEEAGVGCSCRKHVALLQSQQFTGWHFRPRRRFDHISRAHWYKSLKKKKEYTNVFIPISSDSIIITFWGSIPHYKTKWLASQELVFSLGGFYLSSKQPKIIKMIVLAWQCLMAFA